MKQLSDMQYTTTCTFCNDSGCNVCGRSGKRKEKAINKQITDKLAMKGWDYPIQDLSRARDILDNQKIPPLIDKTELIDNNSLKMTLEIGSQTKTIIIGIDNNKLIFIDNETKLPIEW